MSHSRPTYTFCFPCRSRAHVLLGAAALLASATTALAGATPEQTCQQGRYAAAAKYSACEEKAIGQALGGVGGDGAAAFSKIEAAYSKCRAKYAATWAKLQAKAAGSGSTCDNARYEDNGDGTVTDRLTGLQWEQKTDDATVHDKDNGYTWTDPGDGDLTDADGTAYTSFLATLNGGGCFAGQCDWRLPTIHELQTILLEAYPCTTRPCIDQTLFGPMAGDVYWSATTTATSPAGAWVVSFFEGAVYYTLGGKDFSVPARAVRAGS